MEVWAIANQKSGVGKTTTAVTLGGLLAQAGKRTLLVDFDPQGSLTSYFRLNPDGVSKGVYNLFDARLKQSKVVNLEKLALTTDLERLFLLPASTAMATLDRQLGAARNTGNVLAEKLDEIRDQYDYILIDCPPMLGVLTINALVACNRLIIPVPTDFMALKGLQRMLHSLQMTGREWSSTAPYVIVPTFFDRKSRASTEALQTLREHYADHVWPETIPVDTRFREASLSAIPLSVRNPGSRGAEAYSLLLAWLLKSKAAIREVAM